MKAAGKTLKSTNDDVVLAGGKTLSSDYDLTIEAGDDIILGVDVVARTRRLERRLLERRALLHWSAAKLRSRVKMPGFSENTRTSTKATSRSI